MRLLFDRNLSPRLVQLLADLYPDLAHVLDVGLEKADDRAVWTFAIENGFGIVSKDGDFRQLSFLAGAPPKVVWVRLGNCSTANTVTAPRRRAGDLRDFEKAGEAALLIID